MKKTLKRSTIYTIIAMVAGVFYREFTKFNNFTDYSMLRIIHPHIFALGAGFSLLVGLVLFNLGKDEKDLGKKWLVYHIGLAATSLMMLLRGILQVKEVILSKGIDSALSGLAGLAHIALGVSMVMIMRNLIKLAPDKE